MLYCLVVECPLCFQCVIYFKWEVSLGSIGVVEVSCDIDWLVASPLRLRVGGLGGGVTKYP